MTSIINEENGEKLDLAIKRAFESSERREELKIPLAFRNEIEFYDTIMPPMLGFVAKKGLIDEFDFIVKNYASVQDEFNECLAMENLRTLGYRTVELNDLLDEEHVAFVLKTYGKFHAMTFSFKDQHSKEYSDLIKNGVDFFAANEVHWRSTFGEMLKSITKDAFETVEPKIREACKAYLENPYDIFCRYMNKYDGQFKSMLHGDCWSNNMMFKYQNSKLTNMKLIDFQVFKESTPVIDLSYFLYAGAPREIYENIDKYLKIYHESFTKTTTKLGSDPSKLLPWKILKNDWNKYCKVGVLMGLLVSKGKLISKEDVQTMIDDPKVMLKFKDIQVSDELEKLYLERSRDLLEFSFKEGYLDLN